MSSVDRFTCEETFRRLDDYLDRELSAEEASLVEQHLQTCAVCAAEYSYEADVLTTIRSKLLRLKAPATLRSAVTQLIRGESG